MDLHDPNISESDKEYLDSMINNPDKELKIQEFLNLYYEDSLGESIRNVNQWVFDVFFTLSRYKML